MRTLFIFGAGLLAAWFGGGSLASWLYDKIGGDWEIALWGARFLAFLGGSLAAQVLLGSRRQSGGGVRAGGMTMILRPVTGWLIGLMVQAAVLFGFLFILVALINAFLPIPNDVVRGQAVAASALMTGLVYWLFFGWNGERDWFYRLAGKLTSPLRRLLRMTRPELS